jgi:hypothetical protein
MMRPLAVVALSFSVACANGSNSIAAAPPDDASVADVVQDRAEGGASTADASPSFAPDASVCDAAANACSVDLTSIVDCSGAVVYSCPSGQGCGKDLACVPLCQAAADDGSSEGCEFYTHLPDTHTNQPDVASSGCFAAYVINNRDIPASLTLDFGKHPLSVGQFAVVPSIAGSKVTYQPLTNGTLGPNSVAIVFLADNASQCPVPAAITDASLWTQGTQLTTAFHLASSIPVTVVDLYPYLDARLDWPYDPSTPDLQQSWAGGSLLYPVAAWDTSYVALSAGVQLSSPNTANVAGAGLPWISVIASQDSTTLTIHPTNDIVGSVAIDGGVGIDPAPAGQDHLYQLNQGDVLQLVEWLSLSGTTVKADKPIMVVGGSQTQQNFADPFNGIEASHLQLPPVHALGSEYVVVPHPDRTMSHPEAKWFRLVGVVDGTTLTYSKRPSNGPQTLAAGQVADFFTDTDEEVQFVVRSQDAAHPFILALTMTSCMYARASFYQTQCPGDPEIVAAVPEAQWGISYGFYADPLFPTTQLVFTRRRSNPPADVTLDCVGPVTGWTSVAYSEFETVTVPMIQDDVPLGSCTSGRHVAKSASPFGLTIWGWGQFASYAHPAAAAARAISTAN